MGRHGIGLVNHDEPNVLHHGQRKTDQGVDGWAVATKDRLRSIP